MRDITIDTKNIKSVKDILYNFREMYLKARRHGSFIGKL